MFGPQLLADSTNMFQRLIYQGAVQQGVAQDYWNAKNDAANNQGSLDGSTYDTQTNSKSVKTIFTKCLNMDMTDTDNVARFLLEFLMATRCFKITIKALSGDSFQDTSIYWSPTTPQSAANIGWINGTPITLTPATPTTAFTSAAPVTYTILSAKLKQMGQYTFTLSSVAQADYTAALINYTSEFRMAGKWLKLFGLDPGMNDATVTDKYVSFKQNTPSTSLTLQVHGYDNINIHSAIAKSGYASSSGMRQNYVLRTNILWSIQVVCEPFERTYFSNMNTAGKVSYFMPIIEDIEIYFTDDWGDIITDVFDWQIMPTFDFVLPDPFPEPDTIKRARMKHLTA